MTLVRYQRRPQLGHFNRNWNNFMADFVNSEYDEDRLLGRSWAPRVDINENKESYMIQADLPGMKKEEVDITYEDSVLTISGERSCQNDEDNTSHLCERVYGKFSRSFNLKNVIDLDKISAKFNDGVLTVELPKAEESLPRKIEIKTK